MAAIRRERERRRREIEAEQLARDAEAIRGRCKTLIGFVREAWAHVVPDEQLVVGWHMLAICQHLEAVTSGRINRLLINVPPGSSKSILVSVMWPAWEWGPCGRRSLSYLSTSFKDDPVTRDIRSTRDLVLSDWFKALWPEVVLTRAGETSFANTDKGRREGSAFGSLTSLRANRLIVDDPHSTKTAESDTERSGTTRQFLEGARNRLNDQRRDAIIVVMQRLHANDLSGVIIAHKLGYVHLMIPMEFEPDRRCTTEIGWSDPRTHDGELMDPARFPRDVLDDLKKGGNFFYAGQYQQRPTAREGGLFKRAWFAGKIVGPRGVPTGILGVRAWDFAATKETPGKSPDYTASAHGFRQGVDYYVTSMDHFRGSGGVVRKTVKGRAETDPVGTIVRIPQDPGQAGVDQVEAYVEELAGFSLKPVRTNGRGDKVGRAVPLAVQAEFGHLYFVNSVEPDEGIDSWITEALDELCTFPSGAHDDQVDALADMFNELAGPIAMPIIAQSAGPRESLAVVERDSRHQFRDNATENTGQGFGSAPSRMQGINW